MVKTARGQAFTRLAIGTLIASIHSIHFGRSCILEVPVLCSMELPRKTFHGNHSIKFPWQTTFSMVILRGQKHEHSI